MIKTINALKSLAALAVVTTTLVGPHVHSCIAQQRMGIPAPKETMLPDRDVELPMLRFHRLPMVELMINDTGPYRMIVDTGAAGIVIQPELAKKLELPNPPGMPKGLRLRTPGGEVPATLHFSDSLKMGDAEFKGVWTIATALPFGDDMDGVIGMNVFRECLLTYDYPGNRIVLGHGELPKTNNKDVMDYETPRMPDTHPFVELTINGETKSTLIDSGMSAWFSIPLKNMEAFDFVSEPVEARMGQSVGPERTHSMAGRIKGSFELGQAKVENPIVLLGAENMIGTLFLENFVVTFDARNKRVRFSRESTEPLTQPALRILGFRLVRTGEEMQVRFVLPKSDAAAKGLKADDIVLAINGKPADEIYNTEVLENLIQTETAVTIRVRPKGKEEARDLEIGIMELLK